MSGRFLLSFALCLVPSGAFPQTTTKSGNAITVGRMPAIGSCEFGVSPELMAALTKIQLDHVMTKNEASVIADAYRECNWGFCGANSEPIGKQHEWLVYPRVGIGGELAPVITIDKMSGQISCKGSKSFKSLSAFVDHLLTSRSTRTQP